MNSFVEYWCILPFGCVVLSEVVVGETSPNLTAGLCCLVEETRSSIYTRSYLDEPGLSRWNYLLKTIWRTEENITHPHEDIYKYVFGKESSGSIVWTTCENAALPVRSAPRCCHVCGNGMSFPLVGVRLLGRLPTDHRPRHIIAWVELTCVPNRALI